MNNASIGKYRLRFFLKKPFTYIYEDYSIEMRKHILFDCM